MVKLRSAVSIITASGAKERDTICRYQNGIKLEPNIFLWSNNITIVPGNISSRLWCSSSCLPGTSVRLFFVNSWRYWSIVLIYDGFVFDLMTQDENSDAHTLAKQLPAFHLSSTRLHQLCCHCSALRHTVFLVYSMMHMLLSWLLFYGIWFPDCNIKNKKKNTSLFVCVLGGAQQSIKMAAPKYATLAWIALNCENSLEKISLFSIYNEN